MQKIMLGSSAIHRREARLPTPDESPINPRYIGTGGIQSNGQLQ